eukprot:SAG22_NODE_1189_length_5206_cov_14.857451_2_plen_78_part_00
MMKMTDDIDLIAVSTTMARFGKSRTVRSSRIARSSRTSRNGATMFPSFMMAVASRKMQIVTFDLHCTPPRGGAVPFQ